MKIGITGGIGSGKSFVCQIIEKMGYNVFYSDSEAKWLMENNNILIEKIKILVGKNAYLENNKINKKNISDFIFQNEDNRLKFNKLVHPFVYDHFDFWCEQHKKDELLFNESALLFETGSYKKFDKIILITAPINTRIKRIKERDNLSDQEIVNKMNSQLSDDVKIKLCNYIIDNKEDELLIPKITTVITKLNVKT